MIPLIAVRARLSTGEIVDMFINESHVVSVRRESDGPGAIVAMTNGDVLTVLNPRYEEWQNDAICRR